MSVCMRITSPRWLSCGVGGWRGIAGGWVAGVGGLECLREPHAGAAVAQAQQEREHAGQAGAVARDDGRAGLVGRDHSPAVDSVPGVDAASQVMGPGSVAIGVQGVSEVKQELGVACKAVALGRAGLPACPVNGGCGLHCQFPELLFAGVVPGPQQEGADSR